MGSLSPSPLRMAGVRQSGNHERVRTLVALGLACAALAGTACSSTVNGVGLLRPSRDSATSSQPDPAGGVLITYTAGHLQARFPTAPEETSEPGSFDGVNLMVHTAVARVGRKPTLVACEDVSQAIPDAIYGATLRGAIGSFEGSSGLSLINERADTFQGHVAQRATLSDTIGTTYALLAFVYSGTRVYLLFAPTGASFDSLTESFVALP